MLHHTTDSNRTVRVEWLQCHYTCQTFKCRFAVGQLSVNCWYTAGRQTFRGALLHFCPYFLSSQDLFTAEKNSKKQKSARFLSRFHAKTPLAVCRWLTLHIRSLSAQPGPSYKNPVKRPKNPSGNSPKKLQCIDLARAKSEALVNNTCKQKKIRSCNAKRGRQRKWLQY